MKKIYSSVIFLVVVFCLNAQNFDDAQKYYFVTEHNTHREIVGSPDLIWSDTLMLEAQEQADLIAQNPYSVKADDYYGVNIYRSANEPSAKEVISFWVAEQRYFHGEEMTEKNLLNFGHYTQVIWKQTVSVGCAISKTQGGTYILVCLYNPKGNIIGQKAY